MAIRRSAQLSVRKGQIIAATPRAFGEDFSVLFYGGAPRPPFEMCGDYAVVDICGPLVQHEHFMLDSYDAIRERVSKALGNQASKVVLRIDSPGGDFQGSLELSRELRAMALAAGKDLCAFVDSNALSAGYAIASAATSEIVATETAMVGSVGVWAPLVDETAFDRAMGRNIAIIASGPNKAERNPHVAMTESAVTNLQAQVDQMAGMFFTLVGEHRGVGLDALKALGGKEVLASVGTSMGLVNRIVPSWAAFISESSMGGAAASSNQDTKGNSMAAAKKSLKAVLAEYAEGDDKEDAKRASETLAKMYKEAAEGDKEPDGDEGGAKGEGELTDDEKKKEAKAKAEEEAKKASAAAEEEKKAQGKAPSANELSLAQEFHAFKASVAAKEEAAERAKLLASRPDFDKEVRASLENASLAFVRNAVAKWPRVANAMRAAAEAQVPGGTRGSTQVDGHETTGFVNYNGNTIAEGDYIDQKMGLAAKGQGIVHKGNTLELGHMTPEQVNEAHARLAKGGR